MSFDGLKPLFLRLYVKHGIAYAIMNSMKNLRFDKEDNFHVLVFYKGYFKKETENIFPVFPYAIENRKCFLFLNYQLLFSCRFIMILASEISCRSYERWELLSAPILRCLLYYISKNLLVYYCKCWNLIYIIYIYIYICM